MKQVKFNLDNLFRLSSISAIQTFEFENNSAEILISTDVKDELAYELHIENSEGKSFVILDKGEKHISCILTSGMLKVGVNKIQLRGIGENDYIIESNSAEFIVRSFINANVEPTPEEQTAFERLVVKVNIIENDVEGLKGDVSDINRELENKADKSAIPTKTSELENDSDFITSKDIPTVPTKTSQLENDSGFITSSDIPTIPTKTSQLENDSDFVTSTAIPTKTSQLENDSGFVTQQELDSKMEFYKLDYVGGSLSHDGVVLNYAQIIEKFNDNKYFLYAEGDGFVYIPTLPPLPGDEIIEFSSSYIYGGKNYMSRIIINSENQIKWEEIEVVRATDFKSLQSEVQTIEDNKVSAITDDNKSSTENYPSNKAMTDYVAEHGGSGVDEVARQGVAEVKADLQDTNSSLAELWEYDKGQTWDSLQKVESGINVLPANAKRESVLDVRGNSTQDGEPSPDNPQEISSVEELNFKVTGRNLLDSFDAQVTLSGSGDNRTVVADTTVRAKIVKLKSNTSYTMSQFNITSDPYMRLGLFSEMPIIGTVSTRFLYVNNIGSLTFTTSNSEVYGLLFSTGYVTDVREWQLELGSIAHEYEPYRESTKQVIPPFALNKIGDYYDSADIDNGVWIKNINNDIVSCTKQAYQSYLGYRFLSAANSVKSNIELCMSDEHIFNSRAGGSDATNPHYGIRISYGANQKRLVVETPSEQNVIDVNLWYVAETPTETPINADDLAYLKSLQKLKDNSVITITDQNGNDVSYLMEYIIDLQGGAVSDVQINGTSILVDGVANIPKADSNNLGVLKVNQNYGTTTTADGSIVINPTTNTLIDTRTNAYRHIAPTNLDYAVKQAMCDGKGPAWTEQEQAMAQQRIGIAKEWQLKGTLIDSNIQVDMSGCTEMMISGYCVATSGVNLYALNSSLISSIAVNGYRKNMYSFITMNGNIVPIIGLYSASDTNVLFSKGTSSAILGHSISDITEIKMGNWSLISECNIEIYAR